MTHGSPVDCLTALRARLPGSTAPTVGRVGAVTAVVLVGAFAGCGSGATKTVVKTERIADAPKAGSKTSAPKCPKFDRASDVPNGLVCTSKGSEFTFVHQGHTLKLKTLTAAVESVRTTDTLTAQ